LAWLRHRRLAAGAGISLRGLRAQADLGAGAAGRPYAPALFGAPDPPDATPPSPFPALPIDRDLTVIGPMARCAADLSLLLDVIAGPDPLEAGKAYKLRHRPPPPPRPPEFRPLVVARGA